MRLILYRKVELGPVGNGFLENQFPAANHLAHAQIFVITFQFHENAGRVAVYRSVFHIAFHSQRTAGKGIAQRGINIRDIYGYCPDNTGNEQFHAFPAEYHILKPRHTLNLHIAGYIHSRKVSGVDHDLLPRLQIILHHMTVEFKECRSTPGKPLHNKSLSSEETCSQLFLEEDRQLHAFFCCEKT